MPGAVFAPPLNVDYRLIADTPVTLYCVNSAPPVMNLFHDASFVDENPSVLHRSARRRSTPGRHVVLR